MLWYIKVAATVDHLILEGVAGCHIDNLQLPQITHVTKSINQVPYVTTQVDFDLESITCTNSLSS